MYKAGKIGKSSFSGWNYFSRSLRWHSFGRIVTQFFNIWIYQRFKIKLHNTAVLKIRRPKENVKFCAITILHLTGRSYILRNLTKECAYSFRPTDRYIGYLPLAHIMEMVCGESYKDIEVNLHCQNERYL